MAISLNDATRIGFQYYVAIGPQFNLEYVDTEPYDAPLSTSTVKGAVTGVPKLGANFWLAFVGESVDCRWYGSSAVVNDWGDGTGYSGGGSYTHTYSNPGLYYATSKGSSGGGARAARPVRVMRRTRPSGDTFSTFDISYPAVVDGDTAGTVDTSFALKMRLSTKDRNYPDSKLGTLYDRTLVGVFGQEFRDGAAYGNLQLITSGYIAELNVIPGPQGMDNVDFTAYGPGFWMLNSYMREQYYTDPGIIGLQQAGVSSTVKINGGSPLFDDVLGAGYVPNHWVKCQPTICAMHVIQHCRVFYSNGNPASPTSPTMEAPQGTKSYGSIGQFMNVETDSDFDETAGWVTAGYQAFGVGDGQVLSNVRQLIENEGWRFYDRHDGRMRFERKPYYRTSQPGAMLSLSSITGLPTGFSINRGPERPIRQVQVEKPPLATISDATYNTPVTSSGETINPRNPYDAFIRPAWVLPGDRDGALSLAWNNAKTAKQDGRTGLVEDTGDVMIDPTQFYAKWPATPRAFGRTLGPLRNVYTLDAQAYAKGRDKEERTRWTITVPLGQVSGIIGLGDQIALTYSNTLANISWSSKRFDITAQRFKMTAGRLVQTVEAVEADPDA